MSIVKQTLIIFVVLLSSLNVNAELINSVFGEIDEQDPIILELIASDTMQRLKHIDQSGPEAYFSHNFPSFSRYDHSIGVYALLKRYNVSREEQIAGLLHDSSHTVFSHLADILFQQGAQRSESYQDSIHDWFLKAMQIDKIIAKYNLQIKDISPKNPNFSALEQPYPDMNADRIEYNLHTALIFNDLTSREVESILQDLHYQNNKWYFTNTHRAKKLAKLSTCYTQSFWGNPRNIAMYTVTGTAIKYALKNKIITKDDLHFGIDEHVVEILKTSNDPILFSLVTIMQDIEHYYTIGDNKNYDVYQPIKMRGFDPLVMQDNNLQRLSELSSDFKADLQATQKHADKGSYIKFINISDKKILDLLIAANV